MYTLVFTVYVCDSASYICIHLVFQCMYVMLYVIYVYTCFFQCMYVMLHVTKGTPWEDSGDQGLARSETQWEQIDFGKHFTSTKKFFTIVPVVL